MSWLLDLILDHFLFWLSALSRFFTKWGAPIL
jgi:hypothetical protein